MYVTEADRGAQRDIVNVFEAPTQRAYRLVPTRIGSAIRAPVLRTPNLGQRLFPQRHRAVICSQV